MSHPEAFATESRLNQVIKAPLADKGFKVVSKLQKSKGQGALLQFDLWLIRDQAGTDPAIKHNFCQSDPSPKHFNMWYTNTHGIK